jgi:hypothetical protein
MPKPHVTFAGKQIPLPASRLVRIGLGVLLLLAGLVGFLPVVGFWMIPLGLIVLSVDLPIIRRRQRKLALWCRRRRGREQKPGRADQGAGSG